jgi:uncharacterized membrane protein YqaE (UPF0057 family)
MYFWAFVVPPVAVALTGRPFAFLLNVLLSVLYFPGMLHALHVVGKYKRQERLEELAAISGGSRR